MLAQEYFLYFDDCILSPDKGECKAFDLPGECEAFDLPKGIWQKRAFIDSLRMDTPHVTPATKSTRSIMDIKVRKVH